MYRVRIITLAVMINLAIAFPALAEKRLAMVIGNANYQHAAPLKNPNNDALDVAAALKRLDFEVTLSVDLTKPQFDQALKEFGEHVDSADVVLFYFAGHGIQRSGENFLLPTDIQLTKPDTLPFEAIALDDIIAQLESTDRTTMLIVDACRDNPFARRLSDHRGMNIQAGLSEPRSRGGMLVAFATGPGNIASDGEGRNSPFTSALLNHIETPEIDATKMLKNVGLEVWRSTDNEQLPWTQYSALFGDFYFKPKVSTEPKKLTLDEKYWETIKDSDDYDQVQEFIVAFPESSRYADALTRLRQLQNAKTVRKEEPKSVAAEPTTIPVSASPTGETELVAAAPANAVVPLERLTAQQETPVLPSRSETFDKEDEIDTAGITEDWSTAPSLPSIATPQPVPKVKHTTIPVDPPVPGTLTTSAVNIRIGPGASQQKIGVIVRGQEFTIIGTSKSGTWLEIEQPDGQIGFIYGGNVDYGDATAGTRAPPPTDERPQTRVTIVPIPVTPDQPRAPKERFQDCERCPELVVVDFSKAQSTDIPALAVAIHEVTFDQWEACVEDGECGGYKPDDEGWGRGNRPVINISFDDAQSYVDWLNDKTNQTYRLPSGEEWFFLASIDARGDTPWYPEPRYACRYANLHDESSRKENKFSWSHHPCHDGYPTTAPVGSFEPSSHGVYDIMGNVAEWTTDCHANSCDYRLVRGNSWYDASHKVGISKSVASPAASRVTSDGFRVVRTLPEGIASATTSPKRTIVELD